MIGFFVCQGNYLKLLIKIKFLQSSIINKTFDLILSIITDTAFSSSLYFLLILSIHHLRQLIVPFKENSKITRLRILLIIGVWVMTSVIAFSKNFMDNYIPSQSVKSTHLIKDLLFYYMPILFILLMNILIIRYFLKKLKNKNLKKNDYKNEKKAIACTIGMNSNLLLTNGLWAIIHPFVIYEFGFAKSFNKIESSFTYVYIVFNTLLIFYFNKKIKKIY